MLSLQQVRPWLLLLIVIGLNVTLVSAEVTEDDVSDFFLNTYNPNVDVIFPDIPLMMSVFGGQTIHIIIEDSQDSNANIEMTAITDSNAYITDLTSGPPENPTLRLRSDKATVERIKNSADPVGTTNAAFISGDITYEGVGFSSSIKVLMLKTVQFFAKLFGVI